MRCTAVAGALLIVACGDGGSADPAADADVGPDADPCAVSPPTGLLSSVDELDTSACDLAGFDASGVEELWWLDDASGGEPLRLFRHECGHLAASDGRYVEIVDGGVFMRKEISYAGGQFTFTDAVYLCGPPNAEHAWTGVSRSCYPDFEGGIECGDGTAGVRPFGWNEGDVESEGIELVSAWAGGDTPWDDTNVVGVRVRDGIAYVAARVGLRIVDVSDPTAPVDLAYRHFASSYMNDIELVERAGKVYVLLAEGSDGVMVFDVTDPADPEHVATLEHSPGLVSGVHRTFLEQREAGGARLYMADGSGPAISIWDVTDPTQANQLGLYMDSDSFAGFHDLHVANDVMYLNDMYGSRFTVVDASDPFRPVQLGSAGDERIGLSHSAWVTEVGGRTVAVVGDEGFDTTITVVDVDPSSPDFTTVLGAWKLRPEVSAHHMVARGDRVYVTHYLDGLRVLDISDVANPTQVAFFNTWDRDFVPGGTFYGAYDLELSDDYIYVVDTSRGLLILREAASTP